MTLLERSCVCTSWALQHVDNVVATYCVRAPVRWTLRAVLVEATATANASDFWWFADSERTAADYRVDRDLRYLRVAPLDVLRRIFVQYRFFTHSYIADLGI